LQENVLTYTKTSVIIPSLTVKNVRGTQKPLKLLGFWVL